jgi:hypothetical protein
LDGYRTNVKSGRRDVDSPVPTTIRTSEMVGQLAWPRSRSHWYFVFLVVAVAMAMVCLRPRGQTQAPAMRPSECIGRMVFNSNCALGKDYAFL